MKKALFQATSRYSLHDREGARGLFGGQRTERTERTERTRGTRGEAYTWGGLHVGRERRERRERRELREILQARDIYR